MNIFQKGLSQQLDGCIDTVTDDLFAEFEVEAHFQHLAPGVWSDVRNWVRRQAMLHATSSETMVLLG